MSKFLLAHLLNSLAHSLQYQYITFAQVGSCFHLWFYLLNVVQWIRLGAFYILFHNESRTACCYSYLFSQAIPALTTECQWSVLPFLACASQDTTICLPFIIIQSRNTNELVSGKQRQWVGCVLCNMRQPPAGSFYLAQTESLMGRHKLDK